MSMALLWYLIENEQTISSLSRFFQNLVVIFGSFYTQISCFVANRFTFSPSLFAVRQEEPTSVVFSSLHILRKGISVVVQ